MLNTVTTHVLSLHASVVLGQEELLSCMKARSRLYEDLHKVSLSSHLKRSPNKPSSNKHSSNKHSAYKPTNSLRTRTPRILSPSPPFSPSLTSSVYTPHSQTFQPDGSTGTGAAGGGSSTGPNNHAYSSLLPTLEAYISGTLEEYTGGAGEDDRSLVSRNTMRCATYASNTFFYQCILSNHPLTPISTHISLLCHPPFTTLSLPYQPLSLAPPPLSPPPFPPVTPPYH